MNKLWILTGWLMTTAFPCLAQNQLDAKQQWIEQVDAGFAFPASHNAAADYNFGYGGDVLVGYRFNRDFSLSGDVGYYDCNEKLSAGVSTGGWVYMPMMAVARFNFGPGWVRPYLILGAGGAVNSYSLGPGISPGKQSQIVFNPLLAPGLGILFVVAQNLAVYGQARLDLDFATPGGSWQDNPTIFIPLKAGLTVFVL